MPSAGASTGRVPRDFAMVAGRNNGTAARAVLDVPLGAVPDLVVRASRQRPVLGRGVWRLRHTRHRSALGLRWFPRIPVLEMTRLVLTRRFHTAGFGRLRFVQGRYRKFQAT